MADTWPPRPSAPAGEPPPLETAAGGEVCDVGGVLHGLLEMVVEVGDGELGGAKGRQPPSLE
ncbi:hypothetical protein [Sinosporangium siamense]|uniref:hypothetical protein n=1 Tax=Sinosporangium siamense TaxID=1367973 RepID=UPI001950F842|nr:hypothetical protein [Sinosporangium siamense]